MAEKTDPSDKVLEFLSTQEGQSKLARVMTDEVYGRLSKQREEALLRRMLPVQVIPPGSDHDPET